VDGAGSWGARWTLADVSDFIGHSDVKVTRDRYAARLTETKVRLAAGIQPCRLTSNEPSRLLGDEGVGGQKVAGCSSTSTELTTENVWAPELGLEPRTTRLTVERSTN
jgi:hypothetical protein